MRGRPPKSPGTAVGHRRKPKLELSKRPKVPIPPKGLLRVTRAAWFRLWETAVGKRWDERSDLGAVEKLFFLQDQRERARRKLRKEGLTVPGSKGQPRMNPLAGYIAGLDGQLLALEDRLGLSPLARLRLGISQLRDGLDEKNAEIHIVNDDDDPRLAGDESRQESGENA